ncbi:MAG: DNA-binding response regulator [Micavibrio sp.]|nr:MAG: DNA-binding response regulator [Micavibrio sp.]
MNKITPDIVIFEQDETARRVISEAMQAEELGAVRFVDDCSGDDSDGVQIYLCAQGTLPPDDLKLAESDVFTKPLRLGRLLDRVRRRQRSQNRKNQENFIRIGLYDLDANNNLLGDIRLTEKETAILELLHAQKGRSMSRQELLDSVWGYAEGVETHTLETHIYRLRQKIEKDATAPEILLTDESGYRLGKV